MADGDTEEWRRIFDVNVLALCICTREAVKIMKENGIAGHIVLMNSVVGHYVPCLPKPNFNVYPASKFAVTALTESLRQELRFHELGIKVTVSCLDPLRSKITRWNMHVLAMGYQVSIGWHQYGRSVDSFIKLTIFYRAVTSQNENSLSSLG